MTDRERNPTPVSEEEQGQERSLGPTGSPQDSFPLLLGQGCRSGSGTTNMTGMEGKDRHSMTQADTAPSGGSFLSWWLMPLRSPSDDGDEPVVNGRSSSLGEHLRAVSEDRYVGGAGVDRVTC